MIISLLAIAVLGWGLGLGLALFGAAQENEMADWFKITVGCFLRLGDLATLGVLITMVWS
jgi:hypothetical protein